MTNPDSEEPLRPQPSSTHSSQSSVPGINRDDDAFTTYLREHPDNNVSVPELTMQMSRSQETLATGAGTEQRQEHGQTDDGEWACDFQKPSLTALLV